MGRIPQSFGVSPAPLNALIRPRYYTRSFKADFIGLPFSFLLTVESINQHM
jgi:hypothetical protein